ncbi:MAG: hypothetical protein A3F84_10395 [Candidatus Handelsmanbacteria bacterium RIFCSPLOWO2_12_FULL_64_10]|uniref:Uncharacterized protein n=1 Tax=Handelsmanbacteria sp. (strain RIFCSPLOWO2_12_FULL_64_10) TaxID=1817868 RepID=A0A1F6CAI8_HANXR|nr:MAG: hypothetical protein A3F84_10395 [Candidatus Handelsmanbacteria bacterium RIFCSPLOWO2_12_FULL_64_10]
MKVIAWLAFVLIVAVPGAVGSVKTEGQRSIVPAGQSFTVPGGLCPLSVLAFDRDGDGEVDRVIVELDLKCTARVQRALKEIKSADEDAMKRLAPPQSKQRGKSQ